MFTESNKVLIKSTIKQILLPIAVIMTVSLTIRYTVGGACPYTIFRLLWSPEWNDLAIIPQATDLN